MGADPRFTLLELPVNNLLDLATDLDESQMLVTLVVSLLTSKTARVTYYFSPPLAIRRKLRGDDP
jgi:hypothetical protein